MDKEKFGWIIGIPVAFIVYWSVGFFCYRWFFGGSVSITEAMSYVFFPLILPLLGLLIGTPVFVAVIWACQKLYYRLRESPEERMRRKERNQRLKKLKKRWSEELPKTSVGTQYGGGGISQDSYIVHLRPIQKHYIRRP